MLDESYGKVGDFSSPLPGEMPSSFPVSPHLPMQTITSPYGVIDRENNARWDQSLVRKLHMSQLSMS